MRFTTNGDRLGFMKLEQLQSKYKVKKMSLVIYIVSTLAETQTKGNLWLGSKAKWYLMTSDRHELFVYGIKS